MAKLVFIDEEASQFLVRLSREELFEVFSVEKVELDAELKFTAAPELLRRLRRALNRADRIAELLEKPNG